MGWQCSLCGKLFSVRVADVDGGSSLSPPPHIDQEFRLHSCELQLSREFAEKY
jgi:hypothetical protein